MFLSCFFLVSLQSYASDMKNRDHLYDLERPLPEKRPVKRKTFEEDKEDQQSIIFQYSSYFFNINVYFFLKTEILSGIFQVARYLYEFIPFSKFEKIKSVWMCGVKKLKDKSRMTELLITFCEHTNNGHANNSKSIMVHCFCCFYGLHLTQYTLPRLTAICQLSKTKDTYYFISCDIMAFYDIMFAIIINYLCLPDFLFQLFVRPDVQKGIHIYKYYMSKKYSVD